MPPCPFRNQQSSTPPPCPGPVPARRDASVPSIQHSEFRDSRLSYNGHTWALREIAAALRTIDEPEFRRRYPAIDPRAYDGRHDKNDFGYTRHWLQNVRRLYDLAAHERRHVLFTADQ